MPSPSDSFAVRLRIMRYDMGRLSVEDIAEKCGVKTATWSTWENGATPRDMAKVVYRISRATGYDPQWLMWGGPLTQPVIGYKSQVPAQEPVLALIRGGDEPGRSAGVRPIFPMPVPNLDSE